MLRRFAMVAAAVAVLLGLTSCQDDLPPTPAGSNGYWSTAPQTDEQRWELLRKLRAIDPCALVPRSELAKIETVNSVDVRRPNWCEARMGPTDPGKGTVLSWSLGVALKGIAQPERGRTTHIGAVTIGTVSDLDTNPDLQGKLVQRNCTASASFPSTAAVMMFVTTPLGTEPCPVAEAVLPTVLAQLDEEPTHGTSPDTPRTVLLGSDPCAVANDLGVPLVVTDQREWKCSFPYRGDDIEVQYTYDQERLIAEGEPIFTVNGHPAYGDPSNDEFRSYNSIVGPPVPSSKPESFLGPKLPVVNVFGRDGAVVEEVLRRATALFPPA
ncbi:hypothetical protein [Nocardia bhagyanarayanae]|uniref:DUF3558 domain-containing protein n=1 Tax=Nocardia bhagyanarayanae TaxID=1215925 RepID=A0A543FBI7_9NOCA|nr:hypothetical protein [Nocardia bhagyanarayanae]TQM31208.1 hypothetical protein FB390_2861 [Nocardia bhagyanarayanae]